MLTTVRNPTTEAERAYNAAQILARNCIERTIGIIKRRFPALKCGLHCQIHCPSSLPLLYFTTFTTLNVVKEDEEQQQYIAEKRLTLLTDNGNRSAVDAELHTASATQTTATAV